ncbi:MAG: HSP90 family protein [Clostridia bacterium]|nr:HSP90 family protein [Clostridia bacterium]
MEENFKFKVNLGGMIDILSNHLYSSPDVFVRELMQNGVDAISARLEYDKAFEKKDARIEIEVDEKHRILFRDSGTGLTEEEIHEFLAVIGQSSKYDVESAHSTGDFIGRFGIGLLSCFMVTDSICVRTRSYRTPQKVLQWQGCADGTYTISEISYEMPIGTEIVIENNKLDSDEKTENYFTAAEIENLVFYYGLFLQYPIFIKNSDGFSQLNHRFELDADNNKQACLNAGQVLLGEQFLDCFSLRSPSGLFEGVAYVIPYPVSANVHNMHRIYLKNMLLTENGEKLLPEWSFFLKCIINTTGLRPTSSREDFYLDEQLDKARDEIADCIAYYLETLDQTNKDLLHEIVGIHNLAVKSVIASTYTLDDILLPYIAFETSLGAMTGKQICEYGGNAYYTLDVNQFKQLAPLYTQRNYLLINAGYVYENIIMNKLSHNSDKTFIDKLTDNDIDFMLDDSDFEGTETADRLCRLANQVLMKYDCKAVLKEFEPFSIPALYTVNEKADEVRKIQRAMQDANDVFMGMLSAFQTEVAAEARTCLYLNTNNMIIRKMLSTEDKDRLCCYIEILYVQALLSGHFPLLNNEMQVLNENLCRLMEF